jgi:hypothetical protein
MSDLIVPKHLAHQRNNVQMSGLDRVVVLVHKDTNRILCFGHDDHMTKELAKRVGCKVIEILHAHDYDKYAKMWRDQAAEQTAQEDYEYLERENATRQQLRGELRAKMEGAKDGIERKMIQSALNTLDTMERKRQRHRAESFMLNEAYDATKSEIGQELVEKIMTPKAG